MWQDYLIVAKIVGLNSLVTAVIFKISVLKAIIFPFPLLLKWALKINISF